MRTRNLVGGFRLSDTERMFLPPRLRARADLQRHAGRRARVPMAWANSAGW